MIDTRAEHDLKAVASDAKLAAEDTLAQATDAGQNAKETVKSIASKTTADVAESVKFGASALGKLAQDQVDIYREKLVAADLPGQAKTLAGDLAVKGKSHASDALSGLGKVVADNAGVVGDKLGEKYGDHTRSAARTIQETAAALEAKDFSELGADVRSFIRSKPMLAVGIAAAVGYLIARALKSDAQDGHVDA